jgi:hypothetical protein
MRRTAIEIDSDGNRLRVFHRTGRGAWTHPLDQPYMVDFPGERRAGMPVKRTCPVCVPSSQVRTYEDYSEGKDTGENERKPLTSNVTNKATPSDQALWDKSDPDGRKRYERERKARKRAAQKA